MADSYIVTGIMSGTSLDGVDLACCRFIFQRGQWRYEILAAETKKYSEAWKKKLRSLITGDAETYAHADVQLGRLFGQLAEKFHSKHHLRPDFISSHGHTIFHQPANKFTAQIGSGAAIAALSGFPVVCDFRSTDVALGGQGAPLVPIGDMLLFSEYVCCLNLGGIANISFGAASKRVAFDICPVNMSLNDIAAEAGKAYDDGGRMASRGSIYNPLLEKLNRLAYYRTKGPKSLGAEWYNMSFKPLVDKSKISLPDKLATVCEHIAIQLASVIQVAGFSAKQNMLVTGGGALNKFLIERIIRSVPIKVSVPNRSLVNFKEAVVFGLLGALRWRNETNTLCSVTGAARDTSSGAVYLP